VRYRYPVERYPSVFDQRRNLLPADQPVQYGGVDLRYDPLINAAYLNKDLKRVSLRAGDAVVLLNDNLMHLNYPVDIYQGTLVVPRQFKEQVFDILFPQDFQGYRAPARAR
jgi:hypothetical protein